MGERQQPDRNQEHERRNQRQQQEEQRRRRDSISEQPAPSQKDERK